MTQRPSRPLSPSDGRRLRSQTRRRRPEPQAADDRPQADQPQRPAGTHLSEPGVHSAASVDPGRSSSKTSPAPPGAERMAAPPEVPAAEPPRAARPPGGDAGRAARRHAQPQDRTPEPAAARGRSASTVGASGTVAPAGRTATAAGGTCRPGSRRAATARRRPLTGGQRQAGAAEGQPRLERDLRRQADRLAPTSRS